MDNKLKLFTNMIRDTIAEEVSLVVNFDTHCKVAFKL